VLIDTVLSISQGTIPYVSFEVVPINDNLAAIGYTYIVPSISALDPQRQTLYFVCISDAGAFLIAHSTGLDVLGAKMSRQDTKILWQQRLPGVLTSLQVIRGPPKVRPAYRRFLSLTPWIL
jgi:hypothetical protein